MAAFIQGWLAHSPPAEANGAAPNGARKDARAEQTALAQAVDDGALDTKPNGAGGKHQQKVLKVDQEQLDALMNLIGELVVSKNSLPFLARRAEDVYGSREMAREIKDQYGVIDRLAQEMQAAIMAVRMQPISEAFDRFPRLVRDLARKLGKKIELDMEGEDTAADKAVIAALGEPLLHIVRNSLDHGIEMPEDRAGGGKAGLSAHIAESVSGIRSDRDRGERRRPRDRSRRRSRQRSIDKGSSREDQAAKTIGPGSDQSRSFAPGFSTAAEISDLSGRGVGMDVVRSNIEKLGG